MNRRCHLFFIFLLIIVSSPKELYSSDSLRMVWENSNEPDSNRFNAINWYYPANSLSRPDSALAVADFHYKLANEKNSAIEMARALNAKGTIYTKRSAYSEALLIFQEASALATEEGNLVYAAGMNGNIGNVYLRQGKYKEAVRYFSGALKVFQEQGLREAEANMLNNLGIIYSVIGNFDSALEYLNKSVDLHVELDFASRNGSAFINIGFVYFQKSNFKEAIANFKKAAVLLRKTKNRFSESIAYLSLADCYYSLNEFDSTTYYVRKSQEIDEELNDVSNQITQLTLLAKVMYEYDRAKAIKMAEAVKPLLKPTSKTDEKIQLYSFLYKCYKAENKIELALEMLENSKTYQDSSQIEKRNFAITREAIKNEFEVKLLETKLANEKKEILLEKKQLMNTVAIIASSIVIILVIILYFRWTMKKNLKKRKALLKELNALKSKSKVIVDSKHQELDRDKIESAIQRRLNDTDWLVLEILLADPVISNKDIASKAFKSVDGIGSSLRRMYEYLDITETKYKKIALLTKAVKLSTDSD